jgi:hypothetical protein
MGMRTCRAVIADEHPMAAEWIGRGVGGKAGLKVFDHNSPDGLRAAHPTHNHRN